MKKIHIGKPIIITNKSHKILVMSMRNNQGNTSNIIMNNIKALYRRIIKGNEWKDFTLVKFTCRIAKENIIR